MRDIAQFNLPVKAVVTVALYQHSQQQHGIAMLPFGLLDSAPDTAHLKNAVHEQQQLIALAFNNLDVFTLLGAIRLTVAISTLVADDAVNRAHNRRQRRTQLVNHIGEEQRTRLLNLTHLALGTRTHPHGIHQQTDNAARHHQQQHYQQRHHVPQVLQPRDVLVQVVHLAHDTSTLIVNILSPELIVFLRAIDAVVQFDASSKMLQGRMRITLRQRQVMVNHVRLALVNHTPALHSNRIGFHQVGTGFISLVQLHAHAGQRQACIQPVPTVVQILQQVISLLIFILSMRESAFQLMQLTIAQMAHSDSQLAVQQLIIFHRLAIVVPRRVNLAKRLFNHTQVVIVDGKTHMVVQRKFTRQSLTQHTVCYGIVTQFQLDVTDAVQRTNPPKNSLFILLVTIQVTQFQRLEKRLVSTRQIRQPPVVSTDVIQRRHHLQGILNTGSEFQALVMIPDGLINLRMLPQPFAVVLARQHLAHHVLTLMIGIHHRMQAVQISNTP